jgi:hypothetical protein
MQVVDKDGNVYGWNGLEIIGPDGKPKGPGGGSPGTIIIVTTSPFTPTPGEYYIYVDMLTPCVINLPSIASSNPNGYNIKNIGESTVKIVPLSPELIDEEAEINIKNAYTSLKLVQTTTNWYIV